jgi:HlyD family secretion protein
MKRKLVIPFILSFLLNYSCSDKVEQAIGYGNFEAREILVSARSSGTLLFLNARKGSTLEMGDTAGVTDTTLFALQKEQILARAEGIKAKVGEASAQTQVLEAKLANLEKNRERIARLTEKEAATVQELDQVTTEAEIVRRQIRQAQAGRISIEKELGVMAAQLNLSDQQIADCFIINPEKGVVLETYYEPGEICQAGRPVYKIADINTMEFKAYLQQTFLTRIKQGQEVDILIDGMAGSMIRYDGVITWIAEEAEFTPKIIQTPEERVNLVYAVKVLVKNDGKIKIGMPGELHLRNNNEPSKQ